MTAKRFTKNRLVRAIFGCLFGVIGVMSAVTPMISAPVYAEPVEEVEPELVEQTENNQKEVEDSAEEIATEEVSAEENVAEEQAETQISGLSCQDSLGAIGWLVCPTTGKIAEAVDWLYDKIESILVINPVEMKDGSPIYEIWKYMRGITNIVFIIFCLVMVYSQITGMGITNYGLKKTLPKLIVAAVLVNLSFLICSLAVDVSNIVGSSLRGVFTSIEEATMGNMAITGGMKVSEMYGALAGGSVIALGAGMIAFETGAIWMLIPTVLGAIVAVVIGLITIALRQAVVALLIMISPLAIVAYMLPNTDQWFKKWKDLLTKMLVFYPMFSLLFGASSLAGFAIIASASDGFGLLLGIAVQIFPLFFSWNLMKMSGTVLGTINSKLNTLMARPLAANRGWADSQRELTRANTLANGTMPSARLMQYLEKRKALRMEDTKNALSIANSKSTKYVNEKIAQYRIGELADKNGYRRSNRYTRNAKAARNQSLIAQNAASHAEHVLNNYGQYFKGTYDEILNRQSQHAFVDFGRAAYLKDIDEENDTNFLIGRYLEATRRDKNGKPVDQEAFDRYMASVAGPHGEQRLVAKIIAQAARVESKQRAEFNVLYAKYGHNGYNKREFRNWIAGYMLDDDGWAVDEKGKRLKNADGSYVELVQGDALTKAPEKLVLYDKRDENGLYYDFKDQNGNVIARVHRGIGADGENHDNAAFIKETLANLDIPIADPINNIYTILSGIKYGDVVTPQGQNEIGLARYSTTIGRAMKDYKGNAAWAGSMFNSGIGNRQIKNSSQHAIWVLDSIVKTLKPGAFNTQNPASVEYITSILNPDNWEKIFTEEELIDAVNINNKLYGGEDWVLDENGNIVNYEPVKNPTYEQRMNTLKRKLLFPAMKKILPAFDRLRTSNTADNQKPGTADEQYKFLKMVEEKWENNPEINFDPTLVDQDLQSESKEFRKRKHDKDGNLLYAERDEKSGTVQENLLNKLEETFDRCMIPEDLIRETFAILSSEDRYSRALMRFEELCNENPSASMQEIKSWFEDLDNLA